MESFYGGRTGASFVIVKRFDGLDIPQVAGSYVYRKKTYAFRIFNNIRYFIYPFIEPTADNFTNYNWDTVTLDGGIINVINSSDVTSTVTLPTERAEGMRQCFEQGGDTTEIVNYGEYVIIDTIVGLKQIDNPDNGKVYKRGMNFDYSPSTNPLAGAEYIGQIVGPAGRVPDLEVTDLEDIEDAGGVVRVYTADDNDLIPGKYIDEHGDVQYNDDIHYGYVDIRDDLGNTNHTLIGFVFPYLVEEFVGRKRSPYYQSGDTIPSGKHIGDLLAEDFEFVERTDDEQHPYYRSWRINLPHGIKGDTLQDLEVYPTRPKVGATIYADPELTVEVGTATGVEPINTDVYDSSLSYIALENGNYVAAADGWKERLRYKFYNYDETEAGSFDYIDFGFYNMVTRITLSPQGVITAYYTYNDTTVLTTDDETKLKWLHYSEDSTETDQGIYVQEDGTIVVVYNTLNEHDEHEKQIHEDAIPWVRQITLTADGKFKIIYNNDSDRIKVKTGSIVDVETGKNLAVYETTLTTIVDAKIDTDGSDVTPQEGDGSQKLSIKYSTSSNWTELGQPLNYVLDSIVVPTSSPEVALRSHLLFYFSDPVRRDASSIKTIFFDSPRLGKSVSGWTDMGYIKGERGNINIFGTYDRLNLIPDMPPENIMGSPTVPDYNYAGWCALVGDTTDPDTSYHLAVYDYTTGNWEDRGVFIQSTLRPSAFITTSDAASFDNLQVEGFIINVDTSRYSAERG